MDARRKWIMKTSLNLIIMAVVLLITVSISYASDRIEYYHTDALGSVIASTDEDGNVLWRESYKPFGSRIEKEVTTAENTPFYTGKPHDDTTGLSYFGARYYDPYVGRFTGIDPAGVDPANLHSFNRYAYANNNPYAFVDLDGRDSIYINYDYYQVATPIGKLPLGHGAVVAVNPKNGFTQYYEFGRYGDERGVVRGYPDIKIPNVEIGKDGVATKESLKKLYDYLSKNLGKGSNVSATYYEDMDYKGTIEYAEKFKKSHPDYSIYTTHCKHFGKAAATARKEDEK